MVFGKKTASKGFGPAAQKAFLAHLAQTSNVSASAKAAGVTTSPVYDLRKKSADFCAKWLAALSEGYARLEANLLSEALSAPASNMKDCTFKQKQMKTRIGMALLAAHKATVRGSAKPAPSRSRDPKEVQARLEARFASMRKRMGVTAMGAVMKAVPPGRTGVPDGAPVAATFSISPRAAAGEIPPGWTLTVDAATSAALAPGAYLADARLEVAGGVIVTEPVAIRIKPSVTP